MTKRTLGVSLLAMVIATSANAAQIGDVFYIALENHNFTQPSDAPSGTPEQLLGNPAASFLNSLVTPGNPAAAFTSYATKYQNVSPTLHPSEPNYVYQVTGKTGPLNDADPYPSNIVSGANLGQLLQQKYGTAGWKAYQEDIDLVPNSGSVNQPGANSLTSTEAPKTQWTVPTTSFSGTSASYTNSYNGSDQYNYAVKHNPFAFSTATNGGTATAPNFSPSNPEAQYYAPLQQLQTDLNDNAVAKFNWITPDQYNDMHSSLKTNFTYNGATYLAGTDQEAVALGDNFLSKVVPEIEASQAFKNNGVIVIWNDETEGDEDVGSTAGYSGTEIVISKLAKGNAASVGAYYTHASDLVTWQNVFGVSGPGGYLGGVAGADNLGALFQPGVIPNGIPEPRSWAMMLLGFAGLAVAGRRARRTVAVAG
ncbi:putative secreted protein with PEP-CTERM sorting signal [Roseiarcus fermentans]|uniref:Putative secreted protein with PEP-CTERM sorting signal n=1 Tax=Roseiarcus fermentans TaxID=1473586 RepID=A0A366ETB8_9HYPH|nr:alkaline phosphatase family protein [Roseiarcus fermentans]RBP05653.1 putative secreted protein with PEP-CTERM sorting signal [Roseiarcus fermentans]